MCSSCPGVAFPPCECDFVSSPLVKPSARVIQHWIQHYGLKIRNLYFSKVFSIALLEEQAFCKGVRIKTVTAYNDKRLKKALLRSDYNAVDRETWLLLRHHTVESEAYCSFENAVHGFCS